jgi:Spy/CpxP family protein refolding chaperone
MATVRFPRLRFADVQTIQPRPLAPIDLHPPTEVIAMKKMIIALAGVAALSAPPATFADSVGAAELAKTQETISAIQADRRQVMLDTLALNPEQLAKFTPIYDEYQAEQSKLMTSAANLGNRLFVADYGGMTNEESKTILKQAFKLRRDRLDLLEKYADKLDKKLSPTKVFQFVQVENKIMTLLDVAAAATIPIVTKHPSGSQ